MEKDYLSISFRNGTEDHKIFASVINQGIDGRLEELDGEEVDLWVNDIIEAQYGVELY